MKKATISWTVMLPSGEYVDGIEAETVDTDDPIFVKFKYGSVVVAQFNLSAIVGWYKNV